MKLRGKCKKAIIREFPLFSDAQEDRQEFKINIGESVNIEYDEQSKKYLLHLHFHKIKLNQKQFNEYFDIIWKQGCYNTCIRDEKVCNKIDHYVSEGASSLDKYSSNCCRIGWEIGRADCCRYE